VKVSVDEVAGRGGAFTGFLVTGHNKFDVRGCAKVADAW
jgi:hypothetical protein